MFIRTPEKGKQIQYKEPLQTELVIDTTEADTKPGDSFGSKDLQGT